MKNPHIAKQIEWLGEHYRVTKYFGSNVLRLEKLERSTWFRNAEWRTVYFGHIDVLEDCVRFFHANNPDELIEKP
jgi:hypothetical protein